MTKLLQLRLVITSRECEMTFIEIRHGFLFPSIDAYVMKSVDAAWSVLTTTMGEWWTSHHCATRR